MLPGGIGSEELLGAISVFAARGRRGLSLPSRFPPFPPSKSIGDRGRALRTTR